MAFPKVIHNDWIGPPDPVSNLRLIKFYQPPDETAAEKQFREMRQEVQDWNQEFWTQHNVNFINVRSVSLSQ